MRLMRAALCGILALMVLVQAQTCPTYTQKDNSTLGEIANLPDGFCVFAYNGQPGIYKSDLKSWNPELIPNTENDMAYYMDISDDGQWIIYSAIPRVFNTTVHLIGIDGSNKISFVPQEDDPPGTDATTRTGHVVGWLRNSPTGKQEVFYIPGPFNAYARIVDFSGSAPVFGEKRCLLEFPDMPGVLNFWNGASAAMWKDQLIARVDVPSTDPMLASAGRLPGYVTIPDSGLGTAGWTNRFAYTNELDSMGQCGITMSHDGQYCAFNVTWVEGMCAPTKDHDPDRDHKGFVVTRFIRDDEPSVDVNQIVMNEEYGRSINWAPARYLAGDASEVNFDHWKFGNSNAYMIGDLSGAKLEQYGLAPSLWMVNWQTNRWTRLTPDTNTSTFLAPAYYLTGEARAIRTAQTRSALAGAGVAATRMHLPGDARLAVPAGAQSVRVYSLAGALLWKENLASRPEAASLKLPHQLATKALLAKFAMAR